MRVQHRVLLERARRQFLEGVEPSGVREDILSSWRRSRDALRVDPGLRRAPLCLPPEVLESKRAHDESLLLARPILQEFTQRVRLRDHVLAYFDAEGWMLALDGDRGVADRLSEIGFTPGTSWAEASVGTNGPGTALAARKPIEVFAAEHYVEAWQPWSSAAALIRARPAGAPVGVVAMTGSWEVRRRHAATFVSAVARAIEERLRAARGVRDEVLRYAFRAARDTGDALVAVDGVGRVIAANGTAERSNVVDGGVLAPAVRDAVARAVGSPAARLEGGARIELPGGRVANVTPVSYDGLRVGAILAIGRPEVEHPPALGRARGADRHAFARIVGNSAPLRHAVELAATAAGNDLPVVLTGEAGTGKALLAQAIHESGRRRAKPFVTVSPAAIPPALLEPELFGYEPGVFTGAHRDGKPGRFEDADGGTLFLDEVSELGLPAQAALLRVLQHQEVVRVGGSAPHAVDVRVLAATNRPLDELMRDGSFRSDLYYRLNVLWIAVPPLSERREDIALLARTFLGESGPGRRGLTLSAEAIDLLEAHAWPGNVRELRDVVLRAAAVAQHDAITARDLTIAPVAADAPEAVRHPARATPDGRPELGRVALESTLASCAWNLRRAAHQLGVSRMTLYRWIRKYGISRSLPPE